MFIGFIYGNSFFSDLENISVEFSDVLKVANGVSDVKSVIEKAANMTTSYDNVMHQASKGSLSNQILTNWVNRGLSLTNMEIVSGSDNQEITWDKNGILIREYSSLTNNFSSEQIKIINQGLFITNDNWETAKAGIGKFIYYNPITLKPTEAYGVNAESLVGRMIIGESLGIYNPDNTITLDNNGIMITSKTATDESGNASNVTVTINPNGADGVFEIAKDSDKVMWVDEYGNGHFSGELNIGGKFIVDRLGNVTSSQSLTVGGNTIIGGDLEINGNFNIMDKFYYDSENDEVILEGVTLRWDDLDQTPDIPELPSYIKSTKITQTTIESPTIEGGTIIGGRFEAQSTNSTMIIDSEDVWNQIQFYYNDSLTGLISHGGNSLEIYATNLTLGYTNRNTNALGRWDFSGATITGLDITFG